MSLPLDVPGADAPAPSPNPEEPPAQPEHVPADPAQADPAWEALVALAILVATASALSVRRRRRLLARLDLIAADWERPGAHQPAARIAAARALRPALQLLRSGG